jgi:hypothetical protein
LIVLHFAFLSSLLRNTNIHAAGGIFLFPFCTVFNCFAWDWQEQIEPDIGLGM